MTNELVNVVSIGGGNGQAVVAKGLVMSGIPGLRARIITTSIDDGDTSTGRLSKQGNTSGYYGDVTRILDALHAARFGEQSWLLKYSASRFTSGIASGQSFGELFAGLFGQAFASAMKGSGRQQIIKSICTLLRLDECEDVAMYSLIREAFEHLFDEDSFSQHSFRNLFLFTLERIAKQRGWRFSTALEAMHLVYRIPERYRVMPVTREPSVLKALTNSGEVIDGQYKIDFRDRDPHFKPFDEIQKLWLDPPVTISREARQALRSADVIIISCGSLKGNVNAPFLVRGMKETLHERAETFESETGFPLPILHVVNLMNEPGNTISGRPYTAADVVDLVCSAIGRRPSCVIYDLTDLSKDDEKFFSPRKKIKLGKFRHYEALPDLEQPSLLKRSVAEVVRIGGTGLPVAIVHDSEKLAAVFREIFSGILAGALR